MEDQQIGWLTAIIIGGIAGWIAEKFMKSNHSLLTNILLGIVGAFIANIAFSFLGLSASGLIGYLIAGVVGACALIFIARGFSTKASN